MRASVGESLSCDATVPAASVVTIPAITNDFIADLPIGHPDFIVDQKELR
jgi:hypothetical protein